jgi:hypothetical protein
MTTLLRFPELEQAQSALLIAILLQPLADRQETDRTGVAPSPQV